MNNPIHNDQLNTWGSHQEAVLWAFYKLRSMGTSEISGIEFGCGHYSTQLFHDNCSKKLLTIETDESWMKDFVYMETDTHKFKFIDSKNWESTLKTMDLSCDVCLIDSFDGPSRVIAMNLVRHFCGLAVVHDQENYWMNRPMCYPGQVGAISGYKYCKQFVKGSIITVVMSNIVEL